MGLLADPLDLINRVVATVMMPPPPADLSLWAERNIVFGNESQFSGPYSAATMPPMRRILDCLSPDHPCRTVTVKGSAQIFKTTIAQIFIGGMMDIDPCDMLYVHPTHDNALRWARRKWKIMRTKSAALRRIFGEEKSRDSKDTTLYQETRDGRGSLQISGANSPSSLSMISTPRIVEDDLSKWESSDVAGDPEALADSRASAFEFAKILKISTPTLGKTCRVTRNYLQGTQERWHVPCPHCDHMQALEWANFLSNLDREHPENACFSCRSCGGLIEHKHKRAIIARGTWIADNPSAVEPSFEIWRAYSPMRDWESIARQWILAEGNPSAEQTFYNDVLALAFEVAGDAPPWTEIRDRSNEGETVYDRGHIPPGALILCAGVDCQGDRVEVHIKGYGEKLRRFTIDYRVIPHHIDTAECRDALDKVLKETWPDAFGNRRSLDMLAIDGNAYTRAVFGWAKQHPWTRVIVVRGAKSELAPAMALTKTERKPDGQIKKAQKRFYNLGVSGLKASLYEQLKKIDVLARGYCAYPRNLDDEFYRQLTAEKREVRKNRWGYPEGHWRLDHDRNEVLDTEIYAEAAAIRCGWYSRTDEQWDQLRAQREAAAPQPQPDMFDPATIVTQAAHQAKPREPEPKPAPRAREYLGDVPDNYF